jgi:hypothetical protein
MAKAGFNPMIPACAISLVICGIVIGCVLGLDEDKATVVGSSADSNPALFGSSADLKSCCEGVDAMPHMICPKQTECGDPGIYVCRDTGWGLEGYVDHKCWKRSEFSSSSR